MKTIIKHLLKISCIILIVFSINSCKTKRNYREAEFIDYRAIYVSRISDGIKMQITVNYHRNGLLFEILDSNKTKGDSLIIYSKSSSSFLDFDLEKNQIYNIKVYSKEYYNTRKLESVEETKEYINPLFIPYLVIPDTIKEIPQSFKKYTIPYNNLYSYINPYKKISYIETFPFFSDSIISENGIYYTLNFKNIDDIKLKYFVPNNNTDTTNNFDIIEIAEGEYNLNDLLDSSSTALYRCNGIIKSYIIENNLNRYLAVFIRNSNTEKFYGTDLFIFNIDQSPQLIFYDTQLSENTDCFGIDNSDRFIYYSWRYNNNNFNKHYTKYYIHDSIVAISDTFNLFIEQSKTNKYFIDYMGLDADR